MRASFLAIPAHSYERRESLRKSFVLCEKRYYLTEVANYYRMTEMHKEQYELKLDGRHTTRAIRRMPVSVFKELLETPRS